MHLDHDLAKVAAAFQVCISLACLIERKDAVDHRVYGVFAHKTAERLAAACLTAASLSPASVEQLSRHVGIPYGCIEPV